MELFSTMCGYSKPFPITTADEAAELQRRFLVAIEESKDTLTKPEKLKTTR